MKSTRLLYLVATAMVCMIGCKKTNIIIDHQPVTHSWSLDSSLLGYQKLILSSVKLDDSTLAISNKQILTYVNVNHLNEPGIGSSPLPRLSGYGELVGPSLTNKLIAYPLDSSHFFISDIKNIGSNIGSISYSPDFSNASSTAYNGIPQPINSNGFSIISNRYILVPVSTDNSQNVASVSLLTVDSVPGMMNSLQLTGAQELNIHAPEPGYYGFNNYNYLGFSFYQKFFLTLNYQFFRIDTLGNVKSFGGTPAGTSASSVNQMFSLNDNLFALTDASVLISQDHGETWSVFSPLSPGLNFGSLTYQNVGQELYAYHNSQIWKVTETGSTITITELDTDGLQTNTITGITKVGKYAFVSTLAGLYYRDTASFNTPKK